MPLSPSTYLIASVAVGAAQVIDAAALLKLKRRLGLVGLLFSLCEYIWAGVSYSVWRADQDVPSWLPVSFMAYVAVYFALGIVIAARAGDRKLNIPTPLVVGGGIFGLCFAGAAAFQLSV